MRKGQNSLLWIILFFNLCLGLRGKTEPNFRNLVTNHSFEELDETGFPKFWLGDPSVWSVDDTVSHSGKNSLRIIQNDPKLYLLCSQKINCQPGKIYRMSAWIKTEGIKPAEDEKLRDPWDNTATVCMEWTGKDGKWLGGSYPSGIVGTLDWHQIVVENIKIPPEAASVSVSLYLRRGVTGKAWYDDIQVVEQKPPLLRTFLLQPNYRGLIFSGKPKSEQIKLKIYLAPEEGMSLKDLKISAEVKEERENKTVLKKEIAPITAKEFILSLGAAKLPLGKFTVAVALQDNRKKETLASSPGYSVEKVPAAALEKMSCYIDENNNLIVHGKPFFPLGWYEGIGPKSPEAKSRVEEIAHSPFNCIMNYGVNGGSLEDIKGYLDLIQANNLKIIYSIKDFYEGSTYYPGQVGPFKGEEEMVKGIVSSFKDHPALLAWYLNDELPPQWLAKLKRNYLWTKELDPNHPCWIVLCDPPNFHRYPETTDILGADPYPIPNGPVARAAEWTEAALKAFEYSRPVWMVPQAFAWECYTKNPQDRPPTYEEERCMSYLCIVRGAKGLIYYSYFDLKRRPQEYQQRWVELKRIGQEIKDLAPIILSPDIPQNVSLSPKTEAIHTLLKKYQDKYYLFAVNAENQPIKVSFNLKDKISTIKVLFESRNINPSGKKFADEFKPYEVHVYELR